VHFEIEARLESYGVPGSAAAGDFNGDIGMFTRTFVGTQGSFCSLSDDAPAYDGSTGPLGPCLQVEPGQTMTIKLVNRLENGMSHLQQAASTRREWWEYAASTSADGSPDLFDHGESLHWEGQRPKVPEDIQVSHPENVPGWDVTFDDTNIHIHGMQVVPHLFYPQGTGNASAGWISTSPASEDASTQCFCYVFRVPRDHPKGTYWWHIHRHGSAVMQGWQGMLGAMLVGSREATGSPSQELLAQGVNREQVFALWEWNFDARNEISAGVFHEGNWLFQANGAADADPTTVYLVNNEYQPTFLLKKHEAMHLRLICAQTTTGSVFYIVDGSGELVDIYVFASDGISYERTYKKRMLVLGPGQREGVLVKFSSKGTYRVMQAEINDFMENNDDIGVTDQPIAFFHVSGGDDVGDDHGVDLAKLRFTPGMPDDIDEASVSRELDLSFDVGTRLDQLPMPQFTVDNTPFDVRKADLRVSAGSIASWTVKSSLNFFHPLHVHVNPFQVKSLDASALPDSLRRYMEPQEPESVWRDTVFVPPYGTVRMLQRFAGGEAAWQGKKVFHCHFLDHEDQGMLAAFLIGPPETSPAAPAEAVEASAFLI
jgi:FtsP/CotA-like multicopper oxidase with cupredoxin domain